MTVLTRAMVVLCLAGCGGDGTDGDLGVDGDLGAPEDLGEALDGTEIRDASGTPAICDVDDASGCADGELCRFYAGCGLDGRVGLCEPTPDECDGGCPQVCGCDGETYCSACEAARSGTSVLREGACDAPSFGPCASADDCEGGQWCDFGGCPAEGDGECRPLGAPADCPDGGATVCGCDGDSYLNACRARAAGTNVDFSGTCTL